MPIFASDILGRRVDQLGKISQLNTATVATTTIFTTGQMGNVNPTALRTFVFAVVFDNPTGGPSGSMTASIGSGSVATDFIASGSIAVPLNASLPTSIAISFSTGFVYSAGLPFNLKITAGGVGLCDVTAYGWVEF